ncbi:MAG: hypothetical protein HY540_07770 [Deltaproteobacteria bacterium]|nr:hypothetical protein [Deltaproteobacteria bacterium]
MVQGPKNIRTQPFHVVSGGKAEAEKPLPSKTISASTFSHAVEAHYRRLTEAPRESRYVGTPVVASEEELARIDCEMSGPRAFYDGYDALSPEIKAGMGLREYCLIYDLMSKCRKKS